jgi:hypothetical protein
MRKKIYLIIMGFLALGCSKEATITETIEVQQTQRTILVYKGATWCSPCGSSGKPVLRAMESYGSEKILCLSSQTSDGLNSPAGDTVGQYLMKRFNQNGIPHVFMGVDGVFKNFYPNQSTADNYLTKNNLNSPLAGVYLTAVAKPINGSSVDFEIQVKAKTQFFKDGFGDYNLCILVLEDDIIKGQSGSSNPEHDGVIRGYGGSQVFGQTISAKTANSKQDFSFTIKIENSWKKENLRIAGIILSKKGSDFDPINGTAVEVK